MAWTWDRYRDTATVWHGDNRQPRQNKESIAPFLAIVDRMFYVAAGAFAVSIVALLVG